MATTKTLAPTNQTITIAAFSGEKPDQRQIADAETKLADAINAVNSQLGGLIGNRTTASGANNNTLIINLESTTSTKEYIILGYGISTGQQLVGFILYARASTGLALIKAFGDRALTATYSSGTVQIKGGAYTVLNLISNNPITTDWTNT